MFNPSDPNIDTNFGFAEFTLNAVQLFANVSYVDFVSLPIALTLYDAYGSRQHVSGMGPGGVEMVADKLRAQTGVDNRRWAGLIVNQKGTNRPLRVLSPNSSILLHPTWFQTYWTEYVNAVWDKYRVQQMTIDTQASFGEVDGQVTTDDVLDFGSGGTFAKPTAADIFSCSTGPFATGQNAEKNTIIPRLSAAFNRSTLLLSQEHPNGPKAVQYYTAPTTNVGFPRCLT